MNLARFWKRTAIFFTVLTGVFGALLLRLLCIPHTTISTS
jgi:hypothetical protein